MYGKARWQLIAQRILYIYIYIYIYIHVFEVCLLYVPPQQSQNPENGVPEGRIHQVERAGSSHLKNVKTPD